MLKETDFPEAVWDRVTNKEGSLLLDRLWNEIGKIRNVDGSFKYARLFRVAQCVLCIPHSNAEEERIFSQVKKNKTCFRPSLDPDETLGSIIATKMVIEDKDISKLTFDLELLDLAKTATKKYNNQHKKK